MVAKAAPKRILLIGDQLAGSLAPSLAALPADRFETKAAPAPDCGLTVGGWVQLDDGRVEFSLATRVACKNLFGRVYMALISATHRKYIAPTMLEYAVQAVLDKRRGGAPL